MTARRELLIALGAGALTAPFGSFAQQQRKVPKIGFLFSGTIALRPQIEGFYQGLKALGYIEGQNITVERREAEGKIERLPQLAQELVSLEPDLIVAATTPAVAAAQKATQTIPIVMLIVSDPVGSGFARSLAHPGGNMTGASNNSVELSRKRLQLLKELIPSASRVAVLWNSLNAVNAAIVKETEIGALALGLMVESLDFKGPNEIQAALKKATRAQGLLVINDPVTFDSRQSIARFAETHRVATLATYPDEAQAGALASYGPSLWEEYRRGAAYVDKILRGAKPSDLPIEDPIVYELVINLTTAKALGVKIPDSILVRADKVIE
jgi:putative ABC transport system substrate-binding protein